jgi:hypothetical protein
MLKGPRPELAIHYITAMDLFDIIFALPANIDIAVPSFAAPGTANVRKVVKCAHTNDFQTLRYVVLIRYCRCLSMQIDEIRAT